MRGRVLPSEPIETVEVGVGAVEDKSVLDGQRRQLGVGHQIRRQRVPPDQLAQDGARTFCHRRNPHQVDGRP